MNDSVEDLTEKEARPSSRQQVKLEHINQRKLLPASAFIGVERFDEERCRKELVSQWLTALNMDCYEAVEDQRAPRSVEFCEVCYEDNCFGFSLHCGHYFCNNCWLANADEALFSGSVPIRCMNTNCKAVIELPHALTFLPEAVCKKYEKQLWSKILMGERWICCEDCDAVLRAETSASSTAFFAECPCGSVKCLRCKSKAHHPMPCSIAEQYTNLLECNGEEMEKALDRDSLMLRRCPACKNCCERSDGCNHMTCPCGFEFCYACGEKFDGAHYECEKIVLQRVFLFDVFGGFVDKDLQLLFEENWKFRVMRRPESLRGCRRKLRKVLGHEEADTVEVYSAALETLERSEVTLHFLKKKIEETLGKRSRSSFPSKNALVNKLYTGVNRLQFMLSRFSDEMNSDKKTKLRLTELTCRMEQIIKDLLRSDFG